MLLHVPWVKWRQMCKNIIEISVYSWKIGCIYQVIILIGKSGGFIVIAAV